MKYILIIVPFDNIYPPMNGGMQRFFHIMHQLAKHFKLTAIIHQDKESFLKCVEDYPAIAAANIYSTKDIVVKSIFSLAPLKWEKALLSRWYQRELNRPADGSLIKYYPILTRLLKDQQFDAIILENMATLNAVKIVRRYDKKVKIIYNAHNVDSKLAEAAFRRNEITQKQLQSCVDSESNFYRKVDAVFACSADDRDALLKMNKKQIAIAVIPNGVIIPAETFDNAVRDEYCNYLIFCGALWSIPNAEGLQWFCNKIWPLVLSQFPDLKLLVVGSGKLPDKYLDIANTANIEFSGAVPDVKTWYNKAAIAIVPLLTGSGTRLKVLEAMGLGVPVISTTIGAEGIEYSSGKNIIITDDESEFAIEIAKFLKNKQLRINIAIAARSLAIKKYSWDEIGELIKSELDPVGHHNGLHLI
ncbi:hypothetical protein BH11BAC5_BH11BAC5_30140 [soil metagenome]